MRTLTMLIATLSFLAHTYAQNGAILPENIYLSAENEESLNSKFSDFGATEWSNTISFTTNRNQFSKRNEFMGDASYNIYTYDNKKKYRKVAPIELAKSQENIGSATRIVGGKFYYTAENKKANYNLKEATVTRSMIIYEATFQNGEWKTAPVNAFKHKKYSFTHPSLSKDGRTLYFASDMPGGFGGMDIYVSKLVEGEWSEPVNLGPNVNTTENELFPFIHESSYLFYSSNGREGFGGMDIYVTRKQDGEWLHSENMGNPVNTPSNDFSMFVNRDFTLGYFSSDRAGGLGGDDIYRLDIEIPYDNAFNAAQEQNAVKAEAEVNNSAMEAETTPTATLNK